MDIHQQRVESSTARGIAARRTTSSSAYKEKSDRSGRGKNKKGGRFSERRWSEKQKVARDEKVNNWKSRIERGKKRKCGLSIAHSD